MLFKKAVHVQRESLFSVSMPETHSGTRCPEHSRRRCIYMTKYEYLLSKKESGELSILFELGLPVHLVSYMEICAYHLSNPELSQWQVALHFNTHKYIVWRAYKLLD